ncbi:sigma-70 family RNA polymerase sigma factor [Xylanimonas allomyrinae]|uniref:Sigma-70 family RNA polymerase sigma factor n=1 Tax=Xylanimonas allomyrinae TaxID=2509459 RepID=A0A4P6EMQ1_9MICO|nr:sigma-70 family RNA polymerase sigma factor [Xylanimonas allomyrinae]QAY63942.1 sigma-70 family RNA polymerase sigma factor [Xylanimonas allomyrinae]
MNSTSLDLSDAELIAAVRRGDPDGEAFRTLFDRHWRVVRAVARLYGAGSDCDDAAQEAMLRVFEAIELGGGPDVAFRAYALTTVRNVAVSWSRRARAAPAGDATDVESVALERRFERGVDDAVADRSLLADAFSTVPARYQEVLWYTVVEGRTPQELAAHYGLAPNGVAVLAARARESLRRAWLTVHLGAPDVPDGCRAVMGVMVRRQRGDSLTPGVRARLERHLESCQRCREAALAVQHLARRLPAAVGPLAAVWALLLPGSAITAAHWCWPMLMVKAKAVVAAIVAMLAGLGVAMGFWTAHRGTALRLFPEEQVAATPAAVSLPLRRAPRPEMPLAFLCSPRYRPRHRLPLHRIPLHRLPRLPLAPCPRRLRRRPLVGPPSPPRRCCAGRYRHDGRPPHWAGSTTAGVTSSQSLEHPTGSSARRVTDSSPHRCESRPRASSARSGPT